MSTPTETPVAVLRDTAVVRHFRTDRVRILCDKPTPVNLDGELRMAEEIEMVVAEEKLRFFYPKGLSWSKKVPVTAE